jgi:predicted phage terminase large subunit-like protein
LTEPITIEEWRILRQKARTQLIWLCNNVLGYKDVSKAVHGGMIQSLQKFQGGRDWTHQRFVPHGMSPGTFKELIEGYDPVVPNFWDLETPSATRRTLILMPRGHLKSTIMMGHMIQWILNYPNIRILLSSGTGDQVHGFLKEIKQHFQFNDTFRWMFPEYCPPAKTAKDFGNQDEFTVPNCRRPNAKEPTVGTVSVGAVVASKHYDVIDNDDVVDKENVRTPEQIQTVKSHLGMLWPLLETAPNSDQRPVGYQRGWWYLVGTTYDFSDAYATVLDEEAKKDVKTYHVYKQSAILDGELNKEDCKADCDLPKPHPIYKHCKVLWPSRLPPEGLLAIAEDPLQGWGVLSSQYLMNPIPDKAGLVENQDQIVWIPPKIIKELYAYLNLHVTVDLAGMEPSTNKMADNDYTVVNLHGFGHDGTLFILSVLRGRYTPFEVIDLLFKMVQIHPRLVDIKIEKEAHARVLLPFLKREMAKRSKWLPIVEIRRDNRTSKQQRIKGLQPWFNNGSIKFADNQPNKLAIINEIMRFPKYAHDDILDTIADAMQNRDGGVNSDVLPQEKPGFIGTSRSVKLPDGSVTVQNFNPDLENLMDRIWGQQPEEESKVDLITGW